MRHAGGITGVTDSTFVSSTSGLKLKLLSDIEQSKLRNYKYREFNFLSFFFFPAGMVEVSGQNIALGVGGLFAAAYIISGTAF